MAQRIVIPGFRKIETSGGGEGGSTNYDDLTNKPSINNVPLVGKLKTVDLKLTDATLTEEGVPEEAKTVGDLIDAINSNMNASLETDHQTYTIIKGTDHAGLKAGNYAAQIQSNGDLTKCAYINGAWNSVGSYLTTQDFIIKDINNVTFNYNPELNRYELVYGCKNNIVVVLWWNTSVIQMDMSYNNGVTWETCWTK
nr:MAG TPA: hypothetical protein [Caudoviricetes sp.]